jgi:hypothetical protein
VFLDQLDQNTFESASIDGAVRLESLPQLYVHLEVDNLVFGQRIFQSFS